MQKFSSKIEIVYGNPYVRPPDAVLSVIFAQAGKDKGPIPIRGTVNGGKFQQSLVRWEGDWRLYINGIMAKAAGYKYTGSITAIVGRQADVEVEVDPSPPTYPMVPAFQAALEADARASLAYDQLTPGRRKEILRYIGSLKSEEATARNVHRVMQHLRGEESDALYPLMHRKPK